MITFPTLKTRQHARNLAKQVKFINSSDNLTVGEKTEDGNWTLRFKGGTLSRNKAQASA
ncbi:hypothetical protein [Alishewanella phage vB_AspM_Slicko01]|nr:hypothetical protein [Alishewanella phage vB_AspM_Slicko01]